MQPFSRLCCTWSVALLVTISWISAVVRQAPLHQRIDQIIAKKKATYAKEAGPLAARCRSSYAAYIST